MAKAKQAAAKKAAPKAATKRAAAKKATTKKDAATQLQELLEHGLKDIYWAEKALTKALPKMHKNATNPALKEAIATHLDETKAHVLTVEEVFSTLGVKAQAKKCDGMEGLLKEADSMLQETQPGAVRDAAIIAAAQKVEHYEITSYGTLATFAKELGEDEALTQLLEILEEEKKCDELLTELAKGGINKEAAGEEEK